MLMDAASIACESSTSFFNYIKLINNLKLNSMKFLILLAKAEKWIDDNYGKILLVILIMFIFNQISISCSKYL